MKLGLHAMEREELLVLFDREQRRDLASPGYQRIAAGRTVRHLPEGDRRDGAFVIWSRLDEASVEAAIAEEIACFSALGCAFEWKVYDYDAPPDLRQRLAARGFEIEDPEAVMVLDLAAASQALCVPPAREVVRLTDPSQLGDIVAGDVAAVEEGVWGRPFAERAEQLAAEWRLAPDLLSIYVAYAAGRPASCAWIRFHPGTHFASLWGGATLPAYRSQGYYTALLAARSQEARRRGYRFLTIDASPMSRPIVAKHGFQLLTYAHACNWHVPQQGSALSSQVHG